MAVLGCGAMGSMHAAALRHRVRELVLADPVPERARDLAAAAGGVAVGGLAEAIERGVDAAVVATPTLTHPDVVDALIEAGVPTFCEKPLALAPEKARATGRLADERGVLLQVGFHRRFDPEYLAVRDAVRDGAVGRVDVVRGGTHEAPARRSPVSESGSVLRDLLVHDFDAVRFVTGAEVTAVTSSGVDQVTEEDGGRDWMGVAAVLELDDGSVAVVTGGRPNPPGYDARLEVFGSEGSVAAGPGDPAAYASFRDRFPEAYADEIGGFLAAVAGRAENRCTWQDAYESARIAVAAERSLEERRRVECP